MGWCKIIRYLYRGDFFLSFLRTILSFIYLFKHTYIRNTNNHTSIHSYIKIKTSKYLNTFKESFIHLGTHTLHTSYINT